MTNGSLKKDKGFTIIEVVLVLAIAGLIFLIVFLALPQLQRSRRDTQRQGDAGRALAALESYSGNNNGQYPAQGAWGGFVSSYLTNNNGVWGDPSTGAYTLETVAPTAASNSLSEGEVYYNTGRVCAGQYPVTTGANTRNIAVVVFQESGGTYCQDNR
ncbi:MAG TPA: type II secretion system protein [Candidatus Saccharimonadales bacterium]|jgi:prepilin-type N-terminal cleavage/methylation domain-containing protein